MVIAAITAVPGAMPIAVITRLTAAVVVSTAAGRVATPIAVATVLTGPGRGHRYTDTTGTAHQQTAGDQSADRRASQS
jgi:hypothetical protein